LFLFLLLFLFFIFSGFYLYKTRADKGLKFLSFFSVLM
jgi:hypothetical protein